VVRDCLSAEPLVGLKLRLIGRHLAKRPSFSRTPRGFEAFSFQTPSELTIRLSAEPLVGLKRVSVVQRQL